MKQIFTTLVLIVGLFAGLTSSALADENVTYLPLHEIVERNPEAPVTERFDWLYNALFYEQATATKPYDACRNQRLRRCYLKGLAGTGYLVHWVLDGEAPDRAQLRGFIRSMRQGRSLYEYVRERVDQYPYDDIAFAFEVGTHIGIDNDGKASNAVALQEGSINRTELVLEHVGYIRYFDFAFGDFKRHVRQLRVGWDLGNRTVFGIEDLSSGCMYNYRKGDCS